MVAKSYKSFRTLQADYSLAQEKIAHQGSPGENGHDVSYAMVYKVIQEYIANKLEVVHGSEMETRAWGGTIIRVHQYNLELSRAGFGRTFPIFLLQQTWQPWQPTFLKIDL